MIEIAEPPKRRRFNIDALVRDIHRDLGFFVVLLGLERNKRGEVKKYQIGVFDAEFRGVPTEPELLFRSTKSSGGPIFLWDEMHNVYFHQSLNGANSFFYVTFESNPAINIEKYLIDYYCGLYSGFFEKNQELRALLPEGENVQDFIKEAFSSEKAKVKTRELEAQYRQTTLVMPSGRINQQLAQVQIKKKDLTDLFEEVSGGKTPSHKHEFMVFQRLFSKEDLSDYATTQESLILPEHRDKDLANTY